MSKKVNIKDSKVKLEDLTPKGLNRAERRRAARDDNLTEAEKIQFAIIIEKSNILENQLRQVRFALAELINSTVNLRGLDPTKFGVNLAVGKILPLEQPIAQSGDDGSEPKGG